MTRDQFKNLFDKHFDAIRNYIYYKCGDGDLATDIAQDTFLKIWEKEFEPDPLKIKGLLIKIASDLYISHYRKTKVASLASNEFKLEWNLQTPEIELEYKELKEKYEKALHKLNEKQRVVFLMSRMDGLKYHEIAKELDIGVKAVEKRMKLALEFLSQELQY